MLGQLLETLREQFRKGETYEQQLARVALEKIGQKRWNRRLEKAIASLQRLFNYDYLYIGGGEAVRVNFQLPLNVKLIPNISGLLGGIVLWQNQKR